ncbi:MAG: phosphatase PAP2 family protein [Gemmatimonadota bacterium]
MTDAADAVATRPLDRLVGGYLLVSAVPLAFPDRPDAWPLLLLAHLSLGALLLAGWVDRVRRRVPSSGRRVARLACDWYPLLLIPFLYWELPLLAGSLWDGRFFDGVVLRWEDALFGAQPSATLAMRWDNLLLSELLHGAYLAYYPVVLLVPAVLYVRRRAEAFHATIFALTLGFTAHYAVFVAFPVQGPRYLFPAPDGDLAVGALYRLTHAILESGSSQGAAFPSAHAALAVVQAVNAARFLPATTPLLALATAGIAVGGVYGGFHYGVDMLAGIATGLIAGLAAPAVRKALR